MYVCMYVYTYTHIPIAIVLLNVRALVAYLEETVLLIFIFIIYL